jgi:hypothetical protein
MAEMPMSDSPNEGKGVNTDCGNSGLDAVRQVEEDAEELPVDAEDGTNAETIIIGGEGILGGASDDDEILEFDPDGGDGVQVDDDLSLDPLAPRIPNRQGSAVGDPGSAGAFIPATGSGTANTAGIGPDAGSGAGTAPGIVSETAPGSGAGTAPGTGSETAPGSRDVTAPVIGSEAAPVTGSEAAPGAGSEAAPGTGSEAAPGTGSESAPGIGDGAKFGDDTGPGFDALVFGDGGFGTEASPEDTLEGSADESPEVMPEVSPNDFEGGAKSSSPGRAGAAGGKSKIGSGAVTSSGGASQNVTKDVGDNGSSCFPASATVLLDTGATVPMSSLKLGDSVHVGAGAFSPVFMFTHKLVNHMSPFVTLTTASGTSLSASPGHFIYANDALVAASRIIVGDLLKTGAGIDDAVISIARADNVGLYNPQTLHGDIVVNGIRASTYTTAVAPTVAHSVLSPFRALYEIAGWSTSALEAGADRLAKFAPSGAAVVY